MARPVRLFVALLALLVCAAIVPAEVHSPTSAPAAEVAGTATVTLGRSTVALDGPWKFTVGDSPLDPATHRPLWAAQNFDDSRWETVRLTPWPNDADASTADGRQLQSWRARADAGYTGWAWYRLRIRVAANPGAQPAIDAPWPKKIEGATSAEDAWQLFADGQMLGSFGVFDRSGGVRRIYTARPLMFTLPPAEPPQSGVATETLALRVWMGPGNLASTNAGGLLDAPLLVAGSAVEAQSRLDWQRVLVHRIDEAAYIALFLLLAALAASLIMFDPADRVYLWVTATMLSAPLGYILVDLSAFTTWLDCRVADVLASTNDALWAAGWMMVWWVWFRLRRPAWVPKAVALLVIPFALTDALKVGFIDYGIALPHGPHSAVLQALGGASLAFRLIFVAGIALLVTMGIRTQGREGWFALPAVVALAAEMLGEVFGVVIVGRFHGVAVRLWDVTDPFLVAVLVVLMLRRLLHSLRQQRQMALDVKQAQELQQVILPQAQPRMRGMTIESEYRPALEVGGDFFQIIPHKTDGSVLIVAGDVIGKGLKAGMLVALLVGTIQTTSETTAEPLEVLRALNRRLMGRSNAQATCLALRVREDGSSTIANAGHPPPYLNGEPIAMEGALPLGIIEDADFSVIRFRLRTGDRLVIASDGLAEARNRDGQLFGFARVQELVRTRLAVAEVARAVQDFGQEDDISIIALTRTGVTEPVPA